MIDPGLRRLPAPGWLLGAWLWGLLIAGQGYADVLWLADNSEPQFGRIERLSDGSLQFQAWDPQREAFAATQEFSPQQVADWLITIDRQRLQRRPQQSAQVDLAYAEELAVQRRDPLAARLARRLYLLAAANGSPDVTRRALLGLRSLTTDPQRKQAIERRLQLSTEPTRQGQPAVAEPTTPSWTEVEGQLMLRLVRAIRRGDQALAGQMLADPKHQDWLNRWAPHCSQTELQQMTRQDSLAPEQRVVLLDVELWIETGSFNDAGASQPAGLWLDLARDPRQVDALWPTWESLTEFDPLANRYQNGRWQRGN